MKLELKKVKLNMAFSEETICFQADVYADGKLVGHASNRGHGGPTDVDIKNKEDREKINAYIKTLDPIIFENTAMVQDLEMVVDELVNEHLKEKEEQKFAKKGLKEKEKMAKLGLKCVEIRGSSTVLWCGFKDEAMLPAYVEKMKEKHKLGASATYKVI